MKKREEECKINIVRGKAEENPMPHVAVSNEPHRFTLIGEKREILDNNFNGSPVPMSLTIIRTNEAPPIPLYDKPLNATPFKPSAKLNQSELFKKNARITYCDLAPLNTISLPAPHCIGLMCDAEPLPGKAPGSEGQDIIVVEGVSGLKAPENYINPYVLGIHEKSSSPKYKR